MKILLFSVLLTIAVSGAFGQTWENMADPALQLKGAKIYAQNPEKTYLGALVGEVREDSIFNQAGSYGSNVSDTSIWNSVCRFGNPAGDYSAFNPVSEKPPVMMKDGKVMGCVTVNESITNRISPGFLKSLKDQFGL